MRKVTFFIMDNTGGAYCSTQAAIISLLVAKGICPLSEAKKLVKKVKEEALKQDTSFCRVSKEWFFYAEKNTLTKARS